eukprot:TRINITY_DN57184_c0_g1_i1.p1 TRINITY_DN57184_c0_g1~~TRINITY_DN57184_c0_g1_i1.p1  ORF type:complete len:154 (+),score=36.44 TRINITY_DN57184_c0_g1_i1:82-543(+)
MAAAPRGPGPDAGGRAAAGAQGRAELPQRRRPRGAPSLLLRCAAAMAAATQLLEAALLIAWPDTYAVRLGHDGRCLARLFGALSLLAAWGTVQAAFGGGTHGYRHAIGLHAAAAATFAYDVFLDPDSSYSRSSFGFMMLVHMLSAAWMAVALL